MSPRTKLLVLNSPGNPTGVVYTREELERIAALCLRHDVLVLSDEIYSRMVFGRAHDSLATLDGMRERTILLDGFSKTRCMTGWRLGWAVAPRPVAAIFERLMTNSASCCVNFAQHGALAALQVPDADIQAMTDVFERRRDALVGGLNTLPGIVCDAPEGSFFAFADIRGTGEDARELADRLLEDVGVACVEGPAFGAGGAGHLRFSFATDETRIREAVERMRAAL